MPDDQPQQPANEEQPAEDSPQLASEGSRPAGGMVTPGACGPAEAQPDAEVPPNGEAQPGEPAWPDDKDALTGLVLVPGDEPVPANRVLLPEPAGPGGGAGGGLCWSFGVNLDAILAAAANAAPGPGPGPGQGTLAGPAGPAADGPAGSDPAGSGPGGEDADPAGAGGVLLPDEGGLGLDVVAEYLPGSAGLAAWLDQRDPAEASDYDLPAVAAGWRRVAAWAQAREFAAIAQIAARSAARNDKAGLREDGRPAAVTPDAAAQVGLALALAPGTAEWWTGQAVTLTWRLPATGAALAAGQIDAYRARLITEATSLLDEDTARAVENDVLPGAGELTYAQLRARLRRAVIIADPQGAEDRRKAAERRARVSLYPDDDGTATLTGTSLPAPHAAAAMARITALARALKASGAGGGTDLLRAHIYLGLLLGTLPPIPPPADTGQPHEPSPDDDLSPDDPPGHGQPDDPPGGHGPGGQSASSPGGPQRGGRPGRSPRDGQHPVPPRASRRPRPGQTPNGPPPRRDQSPGSPAPHHDEPSGEAASDLPPGTAPASSPCGGDRARSPDPGPPYPDPPRPGPLSGFPDLGPSASRPRPPGTDPPSAKPPGSRTSGPRPPGPEPPAAATPGTSPASATSPGGAAPCSALPGTGAPAGGMPGDDGSVHDPWPEVPPLTDADAPSPDDSHTGPPTEPPDDDQLRYGEDPLDLPDTGPLTAWPPIPGTTGTRPLAATGIRGSSAPGATTETGTASSQGGPAAGMLDLTLPWATFAESSSAPGILGRIGPVTAAQARALAAAASTAPGTRWRVILTDHHGHAITTATVTRRLTLATRAPAGSPGTTGGPMLSLTGPHASITSRVSVTLPATALDHISAAELAGTSTRAAVLRAAAKAAARVRRQATADQRTEAGCAHTTASPSYRPPLTIRDLIEARDQTCRFPGCRQPAWRGDLDHTMAFHQGGLTCPCNLGPLCRRHHQLKQQQGWTLVQTRPGTFHWHTPAGRIHITTAPRHAA